MKKRRVLLALVAAVMAITMIAGSVFAENLTPEATDDSDVHLEKSFITEDNGQTGTLRLEAYSKGEIKPLEVVLVLDASDSMTYAVDSNKLSLSDLDKSKPEGYYITSSGSTVEYNAEKDAWYVGLIKCRNSYTFYKTRYGALIDGANAFVDQLAANAAETGLDHKVSVVSFNASGHQKCGMISVTENKDQIHTAINNIMTGLENNLATEPATGIKIGSDDYTGNGNNIMVLFTDGYPFAAGRIDLSASFGDPTTFDDETAAEAIAAALTVKNAGVNLYTVGLFENPSDDINKYLNAISSNYPNATYGREYKFPGYVYYWQEYMGEKASDEYYTTASSADALADSFAAIADSLTSVYDKESVIKDYISGGYKLNETADDVKIYTANYNAASDTFSDTETEFTECTVTVDGDCVEVTGFDFGKYWCGAGATNGKKLIIEIPVKYDNYTGNENIDVPTNGPGSGIYEDEDDEEPGNEFETPTIDFFTIIHDSDGSSEKIPVINEEDPNSEYDDEAIDLTKKTLKEDDKNNYLYGGYYTVDETGAKTYQTEAGNEYIPEKGATIYLHEVSNKYLQSKTFVTYYNKGSKEGQISSTYITTAFDITEYQKVGFMVKNGAAKSSEIVTEVTANYSKNLTMYNSSTGTKTKKTVNNVFGVSEGYFAYASVDGNDGIETVGKSGDVEFTYYPYWVTADGIKVCSNTRRRTTYNYEDSEDKFVRNYVASMSIAPAVYSSSKAAFGVNGLGYGIVLGDFVIDVTDTANDFEDASSDVIASVVKVVDETTSPVKLDAEVKVVNGKVKVYVDSECDLGTLKVEVATGDGTTTVDVNGTQNTETEEKADYWEICKSILARAVKTITTWSYNVTVDADDVVSITAEWTDKSGQTYRYELKGN